LEENFPIRELLMLISFAFAIFVSLIIAFIPPAENTSPTVPTTQENFNIESLFIALTSDGNSLIEYNVRLQKSVVQRTNLELIGNTINDLAISDILDNPLPYRFIEETREAKINSSRVANLLISYSTPDLVDKRDRVWTFSVNSPVPFSLKMPPESQIIKLGGNNSTSSVRRILQEDLLTFSQGHSQISYIIGPQGTYAEANVVIKSAELSVMDALNRFPGINLTDSQNLLQQATVSKLNGRNLDAAKFAIDSNNIVQSTVKDYKSSQDTLNEAEIELDKIVRIDTEDKYYLESLLNEANIQFHNGQYDLARLSAEDLIIRLSQNRENSSGIQLTTPARDNDNESYQWSITTYVLIGVLATLALAILMLVRKTHYRKSLSGILPTLTHLNTSKTGRAHHNKQMDESPTSSSSSPPLRIPHRSLIPSSSSSLSTESEAPESSFDPVRSNEPNLDASTSLPSSLPTPSSSSALTTPPFSSTSSRTSPLNQAIKQILLERPHLRTEDEQLLKLLADKQGAAFESDIRNALLLPKTSVWRLVRRLEREELIDVIKIDNQNLIKLKV
jgi:uncharacterized membrane protein